MKVVLCSHRVLCTKSVGDRVSLLSGIERPLNLIIILYACSQPVVSTGIIHSLHLADLQCFCQTPQACLCNCCRSHMPLCVCSFEKRSLSSQAPTQQQYNHKYLSQRGRDREQETLCHCRVRDYKLNCALLGDMSAQKLPASDITGEESFEKQGEAREAMLPVPLIFLCVQHKTKNVALPI